MHSRAIIVAAGALLSVPDGVWALEYGFDLGYGARYSDNIGLVAQDPVSDIEHKLSGRGAIVVQTPRLELSATGGVVLTYYSQDSFDPQLIETLNGNAIYTFLRDRFTWTVADELQNTRINALLAVTPDNLEQTNVFSTGPELTLRTSSRNMFGFVARYENDWYEESKDLSTDRGIGEANWNYRLSAPVAFVLRYRYESVRYRDALPGTDYVFDSLVAGFQGQVGTATTYRLEAGPGRVRQDLQEALSDTVGFAELVRQIRADTGFRVSAQYSVSDSGRTAQLDSAVNASLQVGGVNPGQPDFAYVRQAQTEFYSTFGEIKYQVAATVRDENFKISPQDVREAGGGGVLEYQLTPRLVLRGSGNFTYYDYSQFARIDEDVVALVGLRYRFRRNWDADVAVAHERRDSTDPMGEYEENSIIASVSYRYKSRRISVGE